MGPLPTRMVAQIAWPKNVPFGAFGLHTLVYVPASVGAVSGTETWTVAPGAAVCNPMLGLAVMEVPRSKAKV